MSRRIARGPLGVPSPARVGEATKQEQRGLLASPEQPITPLERM